MSDKLKMSGIEKVAVLCGGEGGEREVSLKSGNAVTNALRNAGFDAFEVDLHSLGQVSELKKLEMDFAFIALHGGWGEDGTLQALLTEMKLPYTGSKAPACKAAMHKGISRLRFAEAGLRVPKGMLIDSGSDANPDRIAQNLGEHLVVKPCSGGSTVGVSIVSSVQEIPEALDRAFEYDPEVVVEEFIEGKELTVAALVRDGTLCALPVIEIVPQSGFYDYNNKYTRGATAYLVPAPLNPDLSADVSEAALAAHRCLGCLAYSRADFRLSPSGIPYILEINTVPGMTDTSLVPKAATAVGLTFPQLMRAIISASL